MQLERENRGIIQRLAMIANERTVITKTNDPKERRWENKLRNDKRRMLYADKQAKLRAINFDNSLMHARLQKTRSSLASRRS